uniref:Uncharacterized protein n=1 Tax=Aegilops tauschii subsp. strangulata TaxID=200361 RepID=A0A453RIQ2_AEGTS
STRALVRVCCPISTETLPRKSPCGNRGLHRVWSSPSSLSFVQCAVDPFISSPFLAHHILLELRSLNYVG